MKSLLRYLLPSVLCLLLSIGSSFAQSPTQNPTGFTVSAFTSNSLTLTWSNVADVNRTNYVILANTTGTFTDPVSIPVDDTNLGDGTGAFSVSASTTTYQWNTGLNTATIYYFKIFAYNSTGPAFLTSGAATADRSTLAAEPANQATTLTFTNLDATSYDVGFAAGASDPDGYLVIRRTNTSPTGVPVDGTTYTVGGALGDGTIEFIGAIGSVPFNDAALTAATTYHYDVYAYNGTGAAINYLTTSPLEGSRITLATEPANQPTAPVFSGVDTNTLTLNFTQAVGTPDGYIIIRKSGSSPTAVPVDGVTYAVDAALGDGTVEFVGAFGTLNDASLSAGIVYHYDVFAYNGSGASINYLTTSPLEASRTTWTDPPTSQPTAMVFSNATENSLDVSFTAAATAVAGYIAVRKDGVAPGTDPADGEEYAEGDVLGDGVVAYIGTAVSFSDAGLSPATTYHYKIYSFNGSTGSYNYFTFVTPLQGSSTTLATEPADQPTALNFTSPTTTSFTVNYTAAASTPTGYIALRRIGSSPVDVPVDGTTYTAGNTIGASTVAFVGAAVTFNQTGLTEDTHYFYDIFSYNGSGATLNYNTASPLEGNRSTIEATEPASASTTLVFSNITNNAITLNFTNGPGESRIVVLRQGTAVSFTPTDGNSYSANADYSAGTEVGTVGQGNKVVGVGSGPFTITGLNGDDSYHVAVFELNGTVGNGSENYRTSSSLTGSRSTEPTTQASAITFSSVASTTMTVSWTNGNGDRRIVVAKQGSAVDTDPTDLTSYTASAAFGTGTQIGTGNRVIYDGTGTSVNITALTAGNVYHFAVYEYNGAGTTTAAYLTPAVIANRSTLANQPSNSPNNINFASVTSTSFTVNFGANSGGNPSTGFIAVRRVGAYATTAPVDGTTYTAGDVLGDGEIAYVGSSATFNQSSLSAATNYYYRIYSFAGTGSSINYKDTAPLEGNQATLCAAPTTQASNLTFSLVSETQMQVNWSRGNGDQVIVFAREGAFSSENPINGTSYTADPAYGAGTPTLAVSFEDYYPVYVGTGTNVTVTDLSAVTSYNFKVYEFNNTNVCYNTTTTASNQVSQTTTAPGSNGVLTTVSAAASLSSIANTSGSKMAVLRFNVDDDELDSSPTRIASLIFRPGTGNDIDDFRDIILGAELTDVGNNIGGTTVTIGANTITITSIPNYGVGPQLGRVDNTTNKDFILNIWLKTTIGGFGSTNPSNVDGRNLTLSLAEADITYNTGNNSSELTNGTVIQSGSTNGAVSVVAAAIRVTQQPSASVIATQALATQPIFEAIDVNNNRDLGFNNALTVSTSNPDNLGGNSAPSNFVSGVANFTASGFNFPNAGSSSMRVTANAINSAYTNSITVSTNTTVAEIFGGIAVSPLSSSSTNQAVLGFSLTTTGASHDFTALTVNSDVDLTGELTNIRLVSSSTNNYSTGTLSTLATATPGTVLNFTGFTTSILGTASYYFIVADVETNVSNATSPFTLTLTPNTSNLTISAGAGVSGAAFTSSTYSFQDVTPPTIVSITASADPFNTITPSLRQTLTIVFSEAMSQCGVPCLPTFAITSANWSIFSSGWVNATTFEVVYEHDGAAQTLTPETFTVNAGNARDLDNNLLAVGGTENFVLDTRYPSAITIAVSTNPVNVGPPAALTQTVTVTYDEAMNPATTPSIIFTPTNNFTSVPGSWSVGNTVWTQTFTHNGTVETRPSARAVVSSGGATDAAGNTDIGGNSPTFVIDTRPPVINTISSSNANNSYTTGALINIRVVFDQNIVLTGSPTLTLNTGATATFVIAGSSFIDFSYTVGAGENTNDLDVTSFNLTGATILDINGNAANLALPLSPNRLIDIRNIRIDTQAPTISSVSTIAADGSYAVGDVIDIQVSFSENVIVTSIPQLALNSGGFANYLSGSGTSTLTFRYTVAFSQNTSDLDYVNTGSLTLPGTSSIRDIVNINAVLTLPTPGALNSISDDKAITIDTVLPTVSSIDISSSTNAWSTTNGTSATSVSFLVTFNETVTGVDASDFSVSTSGVINYTPPLTISGSGNTRTVTFNNVSGPGLLTINVDNDGTILDIAGNALSGAFSGSFSGNNYYSIVLPEPSNPVSAFSLQSATPTSLTVQWTNAVAPAVQASGFLILLKRNTIVNFPTVSDGIVIPQDNDFADDSRMATKVLYDGSASQSFSFTGLTSGVGYDLIIYPLNDNGTGPVSSDNIDYRTTSPLTLAASTTTAASGELIYLSAAITINSLIDTQSEAIDNFKFTITDETVDTDNAPFKFSAITIFQGTGNDITDWTEAIDGAELTDGTTTITASSITSNQIIFTGIASAGTTDFGFIGDGLDKDYTLRIWLKNNLGGTLPASIDGLNFVFAVNNSSFTYNNTSNNQLSTTLQAAQIAESTSTTNAVDVVASQLAFRTPGTPGTPTQPQVQIGVASNFPLAAAPKVHALDANNNLDINYAESITVNNTNALTQSTTHTAFLVGDGGILTLSDYSLDAPGTTQIRVIGTGATTVSQAVSTNVTAVMTNLTQITAGAAPEPASISSLSNTLLTAVDNFDFTITDDAGANSVTLADNDGLPTRISEIRITQGAGNDGVFTNWTHAIASARLSDGVNTHVGTINATEIVFTGINNAASNLGFIADNASKTYRLRIVLKGPVGNPVNASIADLIDNKDFEFSISNANVTIEGNDKSSALQSSSTSSGNGNNTVTVVATQLDFTTQPNATQNYDAPIINAPSLVVKARDVNGNLDSDYAGTPTLTSVLPGTYPLANTNLTNNNGIITFNSFLNVTSAGNGPAGGTTSLLVSSPGLTTAQSITFTLNYSNASDFIKYTGVGFSYTSNIQYINHQTANITAGSGVELERFLLRDGGAAANDTDGTATVLNSITLAINNWENLRKLALYDGGNELAEVDVPANINTTTGELTISGFEFTANDNSNNELSVKASFLNTVTDNEVISFTVVSVGARNVTSSQFANTNPAGIASTVSVDENRLEVITTKIDFLVNPNPTNISTFTNINNPYMVLGARDANNNLDTDYTGTVGTVTNSLGLTMNNLPAGNFVAGLYNFATLAPNFQFLQDGEDLTLTVPVTTINALSMIPTAAVSTQFDVAASFESFITVENGYELPENILYKDFQNDTDLEIGNSFELVELVLSDGDADGIPGDEDGAPTALNSITFSFENHEAIRRIAIYDEDGDELDEKTAADFVIVGSAGQITFNLTDSITAPDDGRRLFSLRATFFNTPAVITDNIPIQLSVVNATLYGGSGFYEPIAGYVAGNPPGTLSAPADRNLLEVVATRLDFTTQPAAIEGINQPLTVTPVVQARDIHGLVDLDFNFPATIASGVNPNVLTVNRNFVNGVLTFTGLQYTNAGSGTYTVTSNSLSSNTSGSIASATVDVIHVTAVENTIGVVASPNIKGGSTNVVIFGVDINALRKTSAEPTLNNFSIIFDVPYKSSATTILKNFRIFESTTGTFAGATNVTAFGGVVTESRSPIIDPLLSNTARDMVTITFPTNPSIPGSGPRPLNNSNSSLTYYLMVDVDATANNSTPEITPRLLDEGFGTTTNNLLNITAGSSKADVTGKKYSFASKRPPILLSSYPKNGQLNVDPAQSTISLTFDVPVWTYDGTAKLYDRDDNTLVATLTAINGRYKLNEPLAGSVTNPTPLTFSIPSGTILEADGVYYLTIEPGTFDPISNTGTGIADEGTNLFGGISYNGTLYFKIASETPPAMITTDETKYYFTPSGGVINASFNQFGKAYFLIVDENDPVPTTDQIKDPLSGYLGTVAAKGVIEIKQIEALQHGVFTTSLTAGTTYDVWVYAENDALPQPIPTLAPFGPRTTSFGVGLGTVGNPTFKITVPPTPTSLYLNRPLYQICANSEALLADPIIIAESNVNEFNLGAQNFNIILPTGFQFDVDVQPEIILTGTDFDPAQLQFTFLNNTLLNISFFIEDNIDLDAITISNLYVIASNPDVNGSIRRFAGNAIPTLAEGTSLGTIVSSAATPLSFTNSYSEANDFTAPPLGITDVVTAIPNNFTSANRNIVRLIPEVPANDYGPSFFTGFSVTNDELSLAQTNPAFNITMIHTDMNGCVSTVAELYTIYDSEQAIPGLGTQQCIVNAEFPGVSQSILPLSGTILGNALAGFELLELFADIPTNAPATQTILGPDWKGLVNTIPVAQTPTIPSQQYVDYKMDYTKLLNANTEAAGITENPYEKFRKLTPQGKLYYSGGSLGKIEFTGKYRSTADASVIVPIRQEVEIFVPAIPVIEIGSSNITANDASIPVFCEAGGAIILNGYPAAATGASVGTFTLVSQDGQPIVNYPGGAFVDNGNGTATLNPMFMSGATNIGITNGYKNLVVEYTYKENNSPCSATGKLTIRIVPNPVSQFSSLSDLSDNTPLATAFCEEVPLNFNAATTTIASGSISSYNWNFGDINATGSNPNEATGVNTKHTFTQSLKYNVSLVTTSTFGCSNTISTAITIGSIPVANFSFEGVSSIVTTNLSSIGNPGLESTPGIFPNTLTTASSVFSDYTSPTGVFDVTLTVTSVGGCVNEITKTVVVVPKKSPAATSAFEDNFESNVNQNDWIPFGTNVSWERGTAAKTTIQNGAANGANVWVTKLGGAYNANEASALYSPNLDLRGLDRPIITFDLFTDLDDIDGVVLEYSTDNLNIADPAKVWNRLGSFADQESTGVEWYNKVGIAARPGDQSDGDYGWTETATVWRTAKHKLNDANGPLNNNAQIVFRFAFASTSTVKTKDGFAIDNVRIGNGTRTVLVEGFTNSGSTDARITTENEVIRNFVSASEGVEIIKVNYHAAFPGADPFNAMNPDDPGARALYYGIASVPNARLDGDIPEGQNLMFSDWGQREFDKRILDLADADINVSLNRTGLESDSIIVTFSPLIDLTNRATILHVMVVEQEVLSSLNSSIGAVPSGETEFSYVLRKMLPNAAGTKFTSLAKDSQHRLALAWADGSAFAPEDDISVVVFLQDEITKAVYQSYIVRDLDNPKVVTAIEDPAFNSFEVYPNPADRELVITLPEIATKQTPLVMFDKMGKVVHETVFEKGEQSKEIGTDSLAAGVYLIKVESSQGKLIKKVVITHR